MKPFIVASSTIGKTQNLQKQSLAISKPVGPLTTNHQSTKRQHTATRNNQKWQTTNITYTPPLPKNTTKRNNQKELPFDASRPSQNTWSPRSSLALRGAVAANHPSNLGRRWLPGTPKKIRRSKRKHLFLWKSGGLYCWSLKWVFFWTAIIIAIGYSCVLKLKEEGMIIFGYF